MVWSDRWTSSTLAPGNARWAARRKAAARPPLIHPHPSQSAKKHSRAGSVCAASTRHTAARACGSSSPTSGSSPFHFTPPDAGTFWYHAPSRSLEDRALYGLLIVDEAEAVPVDRDVSLVLGGWTTEGKAAAVADNYGRGYRASILNEAINEVRFADLDLSHLNALP